MSKIKSLGKIFIITSLFVALGINSNAATAEYGSTSTTSFDHSKNWWKAYIYSRDITVTRIGGETVDIVMPEIREARCPFIISL